MSEMNYRKGDKVRFRSKVRNGPSIGEVVEINTEASCYWVKLSGNEGREFIKMDRVLGKVI